MGLGRLQTSLKLSVMLSPKEGSILSGLIWDEQPQLIWRAGCMRAPQHLCAAAVGALATRRAWVGLCWASCYPAPFPAHQSYSSSPSGPPSPSALWVPVHFGDGWQSCWSLDLSTAGRQGWVGSCPQLCLQGSNADSQLCVAPDWAPLPLWYTASSLLKFGTPQLRN